MIDNPMDICVVCGRLKDEDENGIRCAGCELMICNKCEGTRKAKRHEKSCEAEHIKKSREILNQ